MRPKRWWLAVSTILFLAAASLPAGMAAPTPTAGDVHLSPPPYPMRARQYLEQGSGVVHFSTDASGKVQVFMALSTGYRDLDESTVTFARAQWKAPPNYSTDVPVDFRLVGPNHDIGLGKAVPGQWYTPQPHYPPESVRFLESGTGRVKVTTDASGRIVHAEMTQSTGVKRLDENSIHYATGFWKGPSNSTEEFPVRYVVRLPHY